MCDAAEVLERMPFFADRIRLGLINQPYYFYPGCLQLAILSSSLGLDHLPAQNDRAACTELLDFIVIWQRFINDGLN